MYEIMRKRRENSIKIEQVCRRLSYRDHHVSLDINTRSPAQFATQELPFIKSIIPEGEIVVSISFIATRIITHPSHARDAISLIYRSVKSCRQSVF